MPASPRRRRSSISSSLGVTAVELLPIHHIADEHFLQARGLTNYWGYSTIGFLAPHAGYAATGTRGEQVREFKGLVKAMHRAGIEVILDVVYNHTAEGNHLGPTLSFKGVDNLSYYRTMPDDPRYYKDFTGTGNSLNPVNPSVLRLIMDSLRYFVIECHVDGFRFDLASALAREFHDVDRLSAFFDIIHQDPVLSQVKLIAEPWDVGEGGYQVGNFPVLWTEWNGMYRDTMRDFWRSHTAVAAFAQRFTGSSDLYQSDGRRPFASINYVTCHDGFTLRDLVTYDEKHNDANLEGNQDGTSDNRSWNCGVEGETDDREVNALRDRQLRNFLSTLLLSQGVPMLLAGDELARTQARQQQCVLPGQRDQLGRLGARRAAPSRCRTSPAGSSRLRHAPSGLPPADVSDRQGARGLGRTRCLVVPPGRPGDDPARLGARRRFRARRLPQRSRDRGGDAGGRGDRRRLVSRPLQRLAGLPVLPAAARALRPPLGARALDRRPGARGRSMGGSGAGSRSTSAAARCCCCAASPEAARSVRRRALAGRRPAPRARAGTPRRSPGRTASRRLRSGAVAPPRPGALRDRGASSSSRGMRRTRR